MWQKRGPTYGREMGHLSEDLEWLVQVVDGDDASDHIELGVAVW